MMETAPPPPPSPSESSRRSRFWTAARMLFALIATAVILRTVQFRDVLVSGGQEYRVLERTEDRLSVRDPGGRVAVWELLPAAPAPGETLEARRPDGSTGSYLYRPGAISLVRNLRVLPALVALLLGLFIPFLHAFRWRGLLAVVGVRLDFLPAVRLTVAGLFLNFFLPSTAGGDLFKAYWAGRGVSRRAEAFVSVFVDRLVGLCYIVVFAAGLVLVLWGEQRVSPLIRPVGLLLLAMSAAVAVLFSSRLRQAVRFNRWAARLPFASLVARVDAALRQYRRRPGSLVQAAFVSLIMQFVVSTGAYFLGQAIAIDAPIWYFWLYVPLTFVVAAIPASMFLGLGLLEGAYILFFVGSGFATPTQAAMLAMGVRLIQLFWALPGGLLMASGQRGVGPAPAGAPPAAES